MAQKIEGRIILTLDSSEWQALNHLLLGLYQNREGIDALFDAAGSNMLLDGRDRETLTELWGSLHGINPDLLGEINIL